MELPNKSSKEEVQVIDIDKPSPSYNSFFANSRSGLLDENDEIAPVTPISSNSNESPSSPQRDPQVLKEKLTFKEKLKKFGRRLKKAWSWWFILYFLITTCGWGFQDFLLSFLATRKQALGAGDTLAFLAIGQFFGVLLSKLILWKWRKKLPIETLASPVSAHPIVPASPVEIGGSLNLIKKDLHEQSTIINKMPQTKFQKIRRYLRTPLFLKDAYKLCFISGMLGSVSPLGYYMLSVNGGEASTVAPMISLYVIVPAILGLVFLKEKKSAVKFIGIGLAVAAVILFALGGGTKNWTLITVTNAMYFLLGFFGWGFAFFIRSLAASKVMDYGHMLLMATAGLMFGNYCLILFWFGVGSISVTLGHLLTIVAGISSIAGDLGFFLLSKEGKEASKVVPLTGTYILIPSILGFVFLNDSVTVIKICGICLSLIALVLLGAS